MSKNLRLPLKKKWFEMTKSGIKTEDYREINSYWIKRLTTVPRRRNAEIPEGVINDLKSGRISSGFKNFNTNTMTLGYPGLSDTERILNLEHGGIEIRTGNTEWGAEPNKLYFVIKHKQNEHKKDN